MGFELTTFSVLINALQFSITTMQVLCYRQVSFKYETCIVIYNCRAFEHLPVASSGQSYKAPMIVIYNSRVVHDLKLPHITTLES